MIRGRAHTPDETLINDMGFDIAELEPLIKVKDGGGLRNATIRNNRAYGRQLPETEGGNYYHEDGLILSFSVDLSSDIATRLHNKEACVEIVDVGGLKQCVDEQLGVVGIAAMCEYTNGTDRNHFLKSTADDWQKEYRIFWPGSFPQSVSIPGGLACVVKLPGK